jgi:hypothetical protein
VNYGVKSFSELKPFLTQSGSDTLVKMGNGETLTLKGIKASSLTADEFKFENSATAVKAAAAAPAGDLAVYNHVATQQTATATLDVDHGATSTVHSTSLLDYHVDTADLSTAA